MTDTLPLPFDGKISRYLAEEAPKSVRKAVEKAEGGPILSNDYPYKDRMARKAYEEALYALQIELAKFQRWVQDSGLRVALVFEGRDAAGKGGTIKRFRENMNPRVARIIALSTPTETERSQWYFQRYVAHLPSSGRMTIFDRSWYNRAVVEQVFGFCTPDERRLFFSQAPGFERALVDDGLLLIKFWLNVSRAEQLRRFVDREHDPLKQWKLSQIDVEGLRHWDAYTEAIRETFAATHSPHAPWTVIRADDKRRARLAAIRAVLSRVAYAGRDDRVVREPDPQICGGPDLWNA